MKGVSLLILFLSLVAGGALAGESKSDPGHASNPVASGTAPSDEFSKLDLNHDGVLSRAEMSRHPKAAHMAMVDGDQDGTLSREEFAELEGM